MQSRRRGWHRLIRVPARWGVRRRSVMSALVVVGLALGTGAAVLVWLLHAALINTATSALESRAVDLATVFTERGVAAAQATLDEDRRPGEILQLVRADGQVVATSETRLAGVAVTSLRPPPGETSHTELDEVAELDDADDYLVAARGVEIADVDFVVLTAAPVQVQSDTVQTVSLFLLGATPAILVLVGISVWVLVGRSLETVDQIRRQVEVIDTRHLAARVQVPPTGDEVARLAVTMNHHAGAARGVRRCAARLLLRREPRAAQPPGHPGHHGRGRVD